MKKYDYGTIIEDGILFVIPKDYEEYDAILKTIKSVKTKEGEVLPMLNSHDILIRRLRIVDIGKIVNTVRAEFKHLTFTSTPDGIIVARKES